MLLRSDVTEHRRAEPSNHRRANRRRDVIVAWRHIGHQRSEGVEWSFTANLKLTLDVLLDQVHRNVTGAFDHHLAIHVPRDLRQLTQRIKLSKLSVVVRVRNRPGPQAIAKAERNIVRAHDLANVAEARVEKALLMMCETPLCHYRSAARDNSGRAFGGQRDVAQQH